MRIILDHGGIRSGIDEVAKCRVLKNKIEISGPNAEDVSCKTYPNTIITVIQEDISPVPIYRRLRDYMHKDGQVVSVIFGSLESRDCSFAYQGANNAWETWSCSGVYAHEKDFLLDYFVAGIVPKYRIERDKIIPYLQITLRKGDRE